MSSAWPLVNGLGRRVNGPRIEPAGWTRGWPQHTLSSAARWRSRPAGIVPDRRAWPKDRGIAVSDRGPILQGWRKGNGPPAADAAQRAPRPRSMSACSAAVARTADSACPRLAPVMRATAHRRSYSARSVAGRAGSPWPFRRSLVGQALPLVPAAGRSRRSSPCWLAGRSRAARRSPGRSAGPCPVPCYGPA
jgi:hypothetical protein